MPEIPGKVIFHKMACDFSHKEIFLGASFWNAIGLWLRRTLVRSWQNEQYEKFGGRLNNTNLRINGNTLKKILQFILFFILGAIVFVIVSLVFQYYVATNFDTIVIWIFILIVTLLGFILNIILYKRFKIGRIFRNNSSLGYIIVLTVFTIILFSIKYHTWNYAKNNGNVRQNRSAMKYLVADEQEYVKTAFSKLESMFKSPNDFKLHTFVVSSKDTILGSKSNTIQSVYFTYHLGKDTQTEYVTKVSLFNNQPNIIFFNQNAAVDYRKIYPDEQFGVYDQETTDSIANAFKKLPDSSQMHIHNTIDSVLKNE